MQSAKSVKQISFLLIILIAVSFALISCSKTEPLKQSFDSPELKTGQRTTCPVMNHEFTVKENSTYAVIDGKKYYVGCLDCVEKIKNDPKKYLSGSSHEKEKEMEHKHKEHETHEESK